MTFLNELNELYLSNPLLFNFLTSGGLVYLIFELWLKNKFSKEFEAFRIKMERNTEHQAELLLNRKISFHEKEREVLANTWANLIKAQQSLKIAVSVMNEIPDFDRMSDEQYSESIKDSSLSEQEKSYMQEQTKGQRNNAYYKINQDRSVSDSLKKFQEFYRYFEENKIFIQPEIKKQFNKVSDKLWRVWTQKKLALGKNTPEALQREFAAYETLEKEIPPMITDIEKIISEALFPPPPLQSTDKKNCSKE